MSFNILTYWGSFFFFNPGHSASFSSLPPLYVLDSRKQCPGGRSTQHPKFPVSCLPHTSALCHQLTSGTFVLRRDFDITHMAPTLTLCQVFSDHLFPLQLHSSAFTMISLRSTIPLFFCFFKICQSGLPWWLSGEESTCQSRGHGSNPWSGAIPHATGQLSPRAATPTTEPVCPRMCALQQEKSLQWEACVPQLKGSLCSPQLEKSLPSNEGPATAKNK